MPGILVSAVTIHPSTEEGTEALVDLEISWCMTITGFRIVREEGGLVVKPPFHLEITSGVQSNISCVVLKHYMAVKDSFVGSCTRKDVNTYI